jgi:hypothetical protein
MGWPSKVGSDPLATPPCSANTMFPKVSLRNWAPTQHLAEGDEVSLHIGATRHFPGGPGTQSDSRLALIGGEREPR